MKLARRIAGWAFAQPYLLLPLTALFWAGNNVLGRGIVDTIPPVTFAQLRWIGAALAILPIAWPYLRRDWPAIRANWPMLAALSFLGITCFNTMAYIGLQHTEAINAVLLQSTVPLIIGLFTFVLFRDRLTFGQAAGITVSLIGVLVIISRGDITALTALRFNVGDIWVLAGLACYALYSALLRKRPEIHWLSFLAITIIVGQAFSLPAFVWELAAGRTMRLTPGAFAALFYVIVFASLLAYIFYNRGVELIGANRVGPFFHLVPVFGSAIAMLTLGERPQLFHGIGYALILVGIVLSQYRRRARVIDTG